MGRSASTGPAVCCSAWASADALRSDPNGCSMRILRGLASFPPDLRPSVVALGVFDGIHLAHAKILTETVERARTLSASAVICTFDPHPATVLHPERAPVPIATLDENLERMAAL